MGAGIIDKVFNPKAAPDHAKGGLARMRVVTGDKGPR